MMTLMNSFKNFMNICCPFFFKNISEELIRLRLFPFSTTGEVIGLLAELLNNFILLGRNCLIFS